MGLDPIWAPAGYVRGLGTGLGSPYLFYLGSTATERQSLGFVLGPRKIVLDHYLWIWIATKNMRTDNLRNSTVNFIAVVSFYRSREHLPNFPSIKFAPVHEVVRLSMVCIPGADVGERREICRQNLPRLVLSQDCPNPLKLHAHSLSLSLVGHTTDRRIRQENYSEKGGCRVVPLPGRLLFLL